MRRTPLLLVQISPMKDRNVLYRLVCRERLDLVFWMVLLILRRDYASVELVLRPQLLSMNTIKLDLILRDKIVEDVAFHLSGLASAQGPVCFRHEPLSLLSIPCEHIAGHSYFEYLNFNN